MRRAIELARKAEGRTSPNPMVGAVIVKNGKVVGEGYHKKAGAPHAEVEALKMAGSGARGATLVINLEPCCHYGKTAPCTDAVIKSGIREAVVGMRDPNKRVAGKGIKLLKQAGIKVETGILRNECRRLNEVFIKFIGKHRPFVILKAAISLDGKIATGVGESKWISGPQSRKRVHQIRGKVDAIMVGAGTVLKDNPRLTVRLKNWKGKQPVRVILDNKNLTPLSGRVYNSASTGKVLYVTSKQISRYQENRLKRNDVEVCILKEKDGGVHLPQLMKFLADRDIASVLIEGGAALYASALKEKIVDKVILFVAPIIIGGKKAPSVIGGEGVKRLRDAWKIKDLTAVKIDKDILLEGYL